MEALLPKIGYYTALLLEIKLMILVHLDILFIKF